MGTRLEIWTGLLRPLEPGHLVDLATGHGAFAMAAKELGWQVTAVDAREKRMPHTEGIEWIQADVRDFPVDGYDCIGILGLAYHLEFEAQMDLFRRCAGTPTIIDTHVALEPDVEIDGYRGWWFDERGRDNRTEQEVRQSGTASWGNLESFWADHDSLIRMLRDSGFHSVWELTPWYEEGRTFFFCV